jgi:hypothetical protein
MASLIYDSTFDDVCKGNINFSTDTFKVMLVTVTYAPNKQTNLKRSDVTNEVVGTGYTAGGTASTCTVAKNTGTNSIGAVTGTFFQATQPVSIAAAVDTSDRAARLLGVVYGSLGQQVKQTATNFNLQAELAVGGTLVDPRAVRALTATDVVTVTPPTVTKGTQATTGFTTQPLRDAGRALLTYTATSVACNTTEALISLVNYKDLTAGTTNTSFAVTSGKKLRLQSIILTVRATSTVNVGGLVRLRLLAGAVQVTSPVHASIGCMSSNLATAVIGNALTYHIDFPEGFELSGTMQLGLTQLFSATTATIDVHVIGYEY